MTADAYSKIVCYTLLTNYTNYAILIEKGIGGIEMATFYLYCRNCKRKGKALTEKQADAYVAHRRDGVIVPPKPTPRCQSCGTKMSVRSDNLLGSVFPAKGRVK